MGPMPSFSPRARWKAVAITATDPADFALDYETKLNDLVEDGWNITGMMNRGEAMIITAQKPELPPEILRALASMNDKPKKPLPTMPEGVEDVVYSYREGATVHSVPCKTLAEAVAYLEEHAAPWIGPEAPTGDLLYPNILPISITVMSVTSYEPADLPLLRELVK